MRLRTETCRITLFVTSSLIGSPSITASRFINIKALSVTFNTQLDVHLRRTHTGLNTGIDPKRRILPQQSFNTPGLFLTIFHLSATFSQTSKGIMSPHLSQSDRILRRAPHLFARRPHIISTSTFSATLPTYRMFALTCATQPICCFISC